MSEPHSRIVYTTTDSQRWMVIDIPDGLISPPYIDLHQPFEGPVRFYYAEPYKLPVPDDAREAAGG